jgi:DNA-binding NarL/FixJ family response regulator
MKILVVDDHVLIRDALRGVLKELKSEADVLEASDCRQAMALIAENADDLGLILLDLGLPDRDGFSALAEVRERYPAICVVVLSGQHDHASVVKALQLGALGYIPKSGQREVMLSALQLIFAGGRYIPPEILTPDSPTTVPGTKPPAAGRPPASPADLGLTERQLDVLALMMQGKSNKAICRVLDLAEPTVKNHVTAILKALKVTNRTEAVIAVRELGWEFTIAAKP